MTLPSGLGVGIPIGDLLDNPVEVARAVRHVAATTKATWYQTWTPMRPPAETPMLFCPALENGGADAEQWVLEANPGPWLVLNEIERGWHPRVRSPEAAWEQVRLWLTRMLALGQPFTWIAPNSNINGRNFEFFKAFAELLAARGNLAPNAWGIHVYGWPVEAINHHWVNFWRWWERHGRGLPVVVTEFGAGPGATAEQNIAVVEWMAREMESRPELIAACFFAARGYKDPHAGRYIGLDEAPDLLNAFNRWAWKRQEATEGHDLCSTADGAADDLGPVPTLL